MNLSAPFRSSNRKIDPVRSRGNLLKPDGSPDDNNRVEIGPTDLAFREWEALGLECPNLAGMREYRLERIRAELSKRDLAGVLLYDPLNIRYATDSTNMQVWVSHNHARACFVTADGYLILWDFHNCEHLSRHLPLVKELRPGASFFYFMSGNRVHEHAHQFAQALADILREHAGSHRRIAVDKIEIAGLRALDRAGIEVVDGQEVMEQARAVKGPDEIRAMRCAIASTEISLQQMQKASVPGATENDIWSILHAENIRRGGEWIECRLLSTGPRTNPWFQECGPRVIQEGDLLGVDTDLVGPYGFCADISRTWVIGDRSPTPEQQRLYRIAFEHIQTNMSLLKPGLTLHEITASAHRLPEEFRAQRYGVMMHGVGLCDEYPNVWYPEEIESQGYPATLEPGMVLCVEAYIGAVGGQEGVKLEDQVLITENGHENLTTYSFESTLLEP